MQRKTTLVVSSNVSTEERARLERIAAALGLLPAYIVRYGLKLALDEMESGEYFEKQKERVNAAKND